MTSNAIVLLAAILVVVSEANAQKAGLSNPASRLPVQVAPPVLNEAAAKGLVIRGLDDTEGLGRVIGHILGQRRLDRSSFDSRIARLAGVDPKALREFEQFVRGSHLGIERVEFVPGLAGRPETSPPSAESQDLKPDGVVPGFPSGGSLVGLGFTSSTYRAGDNYRYGSRTYADGSTWSFSYVRGSDGSWVTHERTTTGDGTIYYDRVHAENGRGEVTQNDVWRQEGGPASDAETARKEAAEDQTAEEDESEDVPFEESEDDAPPWERGEEEIDQFQPGDENGTFCPLAVEICRRGLEQALASGQKVKVGTVRVNPEDPDETPQAPRLVYDPKDLVINPSRARQQNSGADPRQFAMNIPVWVNPPGPGEE
jgi:hypothetical protein